VKEREGRRDREGVVGSVKRRLGRK